MQRTVATAAVRERVLDATIAALGDAGIAGLRIEHVAEAAGVAKTTIYRSWGSKVGLIVDALQRSSERDIPIPDTGSLRGDLLALGDVVRRTITSEVGPQLVAAFVATTDSDVAEVGRAYWRARFHAFEPIVERAVARGELGAGAIRTNELLAALLGPMLFRTFFSREGLPAAFVERTVDRLLEGIAA